MHLTIISGAARPQNKCNTAKIIDAFCKGFQINENTTEIWYLSDRTGGYRTKVIHSKILFLQNYFLLTADYNFC